MLVIVAPGQGAQTPGFLAPWLEDGDAAGYLAGLSEVTGLDLAHFGTGADDDTIRDTKVAQPLLVAAGLLAAARLEAAGAPGPDAVAGHSVGEFAAAVGAGVLSAEDAMVLVRERGNAMADAAAVIPTGMSAVLGGDRDEVLAAIAHCGLTPANDNGPGQIVAAGTTEQLAELADSAPKGARVRPLSVAGAFHSPHMAPAVEHVTGLAATVAVSDARTPFITNSDGTTLTEGREVLTRIVGQIARPVRWDLCLQTMTDLGVTGILELPPAGTLTGIAKRYFRGREPAVETFALSTPDQLDDARAFCAAHSKVAAA